MRIVGGEFKGRRFFPPARIPARPTTEIAKEALFNILDSRFYFHNKRFLDLFAGTGSISYEMYSRGCRDITSVDLSPISIRFIEKTSAELGMEGHRIVRQDVLDFIRLVKDEYDLIFAGPPYAFEEIDYLPDLLFEKGLLAPEGWFILETSPRHDFTNHDKLVTLRKYGQTHFWIFANEKE